MRFSLNDLVSIFILLEATRSGRRDFAQTVIERGQGLLKEKRLKSEIAKEKAAALRAILPQHSYER
ncbi:hypothetical protein Daus18300_011326 [Diaporthe australafricana]|uniref:Uncharacterized protein n=1 Tax=Diaporthe australafricana TaxID=127596 RepID=A0ABR3W743_9PEZI